MIGKKSPIFIQTLAALFFLFIFWLTLAPKQVGGPLTYVIVNGISMEPGFKLGDLVLVREQTTYGIGDAVVYRDPNMRQFVFHRVVAMQLDHLILQGDNNGWLDSYSPTSDEIIGKLWLHIPKLGKAINWMRLPVNAALMAGLFGAFFMMDFFKRSPQTRRETGLPSIGPGATSQLSLALFGLSAVLFLALGIYSFIQPVDLPAADISYQQIGDYHYSATGTPGVYDSDVVQTGEPIFSKLTCFLNIGFTYNLSGNGLQNVTGTQSMYARITDRQSGWQRTIPLFPETAFSGTSNFMMSTLDLCQIESIVNLVEAQAGLKQIIYTLEIVNDVKITANINGQVFTDTFSPVLIFNYDKIHFFLAENDGGDPLHSAKAGMAGSSIPQVNSISFFGFAIPVWLMRLVGLFGFAFSILGLGVNGMEIYRDASRTEEGLARLKYGGVIVNVHEQNLEPYSAVIDVDTLDDLARLAERHGVMILHMKRNFLNFYFVQSHGITYRYVVSSGKKGMNVMDEEKNVPIIISTPEPVYKPVQSMPEPALVKKEERRKQKMHDRLPHRMAARNVQTRSVEKTQEVLRPASAMEEAVNYVIDTGVIEFYAPQQKETVMIDRVRL